MDYSSRSTLEVLDHHCKYLAEGNLEEVLADYNEDSFIINMGGVVNGKAALREFFKSNIEGLLPPDTEQTFTVKHVHGELGYIIWNAKSRFCTIPYGTDTFVVKKGHIVMQSFAGIIEEAKK